MLTLSERRKSLQELEHSDWGEPTFSSSLVVNCHRLRRVPLEKLTPADCRLLFGQNIGARFLVPLALEWLDENPLLNATFYPGDLLGSILGLDSKFWAANPVLWWKVDELLGEVNAFRVGLQNIAALQTDFKNARPSD